MANHLNTEDYTLHSHLHGRERRKERGIEKLELKAAIKYGKKEYANPGRGGLARWRFTHNGVVFMTDESCKHEITSWRIDPTGEEEDNQKHEVGDGVGLPSDFTSHTVFIVDCSGSMRKNDVPGFSTRTEAVYETIIKEFVTPQLNDKSLVGKAVVSLIEMRTDSDVTFERQDITQELSEIFKSRASMKPKTHGYYIRALDVLKNLLSEDIGRPVQLLVVFLSDGAPSDHSGGIYDKSAVSKGVNIEDVVLNDCLKHIKWLGNTFGRDRVQIFTVAFGPPSESYTVLQKMANVLPRSTFQKLGLSARSLRTTFSSVNSSLTSLRSVTADMSKMTLRSDVKKEDEIEKDGLGILEVDDKIAFDWDVYYIGKGLRGKEKCVGVHFKSIDFDAEVTGLAVKKSYFGQGAERFAFRCREIKDGKRLAAMIGNVRKDLFQKACEYGAMIGTAYKCKVLHSNETIYISRDKLAILKDSTFGVIRHSTNTDDIGRVVQTRLDGSRLSLDGRKLQIPDNWLYPCFLLLRMVFVS